MKPFSFADMLLTLVILLITFVILYLVDRARKGAQKHRTNNAPDKSVNTKKSNTSK